MEKEKVLEIEIIKVNEKYSAWHITHQDIEILKRGKFEDKNLKIFSKDAPELTEDCLYLKGILSQHDNIVRVISNEKIEQLINKVGAINEKYGIKKRWRAIYDEKYFYINDECHVEYSRDKGFLTDINRYELGNYFKTREEAEKVLNSKEWKEFWAKVRAGEIGNDY